MAQTQKCYLPSPCLRIRRDKCKKIEVKKINILLKENSNNKENNKNHRCWVNWLLQEQRQDGCHPGSTRAPEDKDKMGERLSWLNLLLWKKKKPGMCGDMVGFWWQQGCAGVVWGRSRPAVPVFLFPLCDSRGACLGCHLYLLLPLPAAC